MSTSPRLSRRTQSRFSAASQVRLVGKAICPLLRLIRGRSAALLGIDLADALDDAPGGMVFLVRQDLDPPAQLLHQGGLGELLATVVATLDEDIRLDDAD